jgi:hypothetical protein
VDGARLKLVGGDSGRYEREEMVNSVIISPSERAIPARFVSRPPLLTSTRRARRAGAAATAVASPTRRLRRPVRLGRSCGDRHARSSHQRLSGLGTACRTRGGRAKRLFGLGYPRDTRVVRLIIIAMNLMLGLQRRPVRAFFRSGDAIERIVRENGLDLTLRRTSAPRGRSLSFAENEPAARSDEAAARLLIEGELKR